VERRDYRQKGPGEFLWFAMEFFPDELWLIALAVGVVFGFVWLVGMVFQTFFNGEWLRVMDAMRPALRPLPN
jgi:hypothetical protein